MMTPGDLWPHAIIVEEETFAFVADLEVRKAPRVGYPVSLLAVVPEVEGPLGDPGALAEQLARAISPILRSTDLIRVSSASTTLHVLLVNASVETLRGVIQRITEEVGAHLFQINGERKAVTLSLGGSCFPTTAGTTEDLLSQASALAEEARHDVPARYRYRLPRPSA